MTTPADRPVVVTPGLLASWPLNPPGRDKEHRGTALVIGGTAQTPGAVLLAGEAALRAGAGKLQIATAATIACHVAVAVPESMVVPVAVTAGGDIAGAGLRALAGLLKNCDAVLIGPGICGSEDGERATEVLLTQLHCALAIDAKATALLGAQPGRLSSLTQPCVVTVNPRELAEALGSDEESESEALVRATVELSRREDVVVLCGGPNKVVASPDGQVWLVDAGGPGLGVSGSGDVQAGLVGGLLARGSEPAQAAVWAAYLHGRAGDALSAELGEVGALAREISPRVPGIMAALSGSPAQMAPPTHNLSAPP